ncbi:MAG: hypothetical protein AAB386_02590 [Patescibacteria group bacterium]
MAKPSSILINIHTPRIILRDKDGKEIKTALTCFVQKLRKLFDKHLDQPRAQPITRTVSKIVEEKRIAEGEKRGTNVRAGRGDTGMQVFGPDGIKNMELSSFISAMRSHGYVATQAYYQPVPARDKSGEMTDDFKYNFKIRFSREADAEPLGEGFEEKLVDILGGQIFQRCDVWENDHSHTINPSGGIDPNCGTFLRLSMDERGEYATKQDTKKRQQPSPAPTPTA